MEITSEHLSAHIMEGGRVPHSQSSEPGFFATVLKIGHFHSLHWRPSWLSCINEYLAIWAIQVLRNAFYQGIWPHPPPPRNANNIGPYTFVMLFSGKADTPPPHCIT